jgi:pantoate--beta-alanine ligase
VREPDGLAMSSRNARLSAAERERATALRRALAAAQEAVESGQRDVATVKAAARTELDAAGVETEYFELVSQDTLVPVSEVNGDAVALVAARVGQTRLIDNQPLSTVHPTAGSTDTNGGI